MTAVGVLLFAGALVALLLKSEPAFWVLSGLTVVWQLAAIGHRPSPGRQPIEQRPLGLTLVSRCGTTGGSCR
jgi:hypothetical protein